MARNRVEGIEILRPGSAGETRATNTSGYGRALASRASVQSVPVSSVATNPINPIWRVDLDGEGFAELQASVATMGVLQPLLVAPAEQWREQHPDVDLEVEDAEWVALDGNRRVVAARHADVAEVPIVVRADLSSDDWTVILHANSGRAELTPIDRALGFEHAIQQGRTQKELAASFGISQPTIAKHLALLRLPVALQAPVAAGAVSVNAAYAAVSKDVEVLQLAGEQLAGMLEGEWSTAVFTHAVERAEGEVARRHRVTQAGGAAASVPGDRAVEEPRETVGSDAAIQPVTSQRARQQAAEAGQLVVEDLAVFATTEPATTPAKSVDGSGDGTDAAKDGGGAASLTPARDAQEARFACIPALVRRQPSGTELRRLLVDLWLADRSMHHEARRMAWRIAQEMGDAPTKADQPGKSTNELLWDWEQSSIPDGTKPRERAAWLRIVALHERTLRERGNDGRWSASDAWYLDQLMAVGYQPTAWERQQLNNITTDTASTEEELA